MPTETIQLSKVEKEPRQGRKTCLILDHRNSAWGVFPEKVGLFKEGKTYEVEYTEREWKSQKYRTITSGKEVAGIPEVKIQKMQTNSEDAKRMWVCALLVASITAGKIDPNTHSEVVENGKAFLEDLSLIFGDVVTVSPQKANAHKPGETAPEGDMNDEIPF